MLIVPYHHACLVPFMTYRNTNSHCYVVIRFVVVVSSVVMDSYIYLPMFFVAASLLLGQSHDSLNAIMPVI